MKSEKKRDYLNDAIVYSQSEVLPFSARRHRGKIVKGKEEYDAMLEAFRKQREAGLPIFIFPDKYESQGPYTPPPTYKQHDKCKHPLDGSVRWVREDKLVHVSDSMAGGQPGVKSAIKKCLHCTDEQEKIHGLHVMEARLSDESQLPEYTSTYTFANFPPTMDQDAKEDVYEATVKSIRAMREGKNGESLFIHGVPGGGKTSLASCACKMYLNAGIGVFSKSIRAYIRDLQDNMGQLGMCEAERLMHNAPVVMVDDLGAEDGSSDKKEISDWALGKIFDIVEERLSRGLVTIITSNNSPAGLRAKWKQRTSNEIQDQAGRIYRRLNSYYNVIEVQNCDVEAM